MTCLCGDPRCSKFPPLAVAGVGLVLLGCVVALATVFVVAIP